jgi:hypothetical protein
LGTYFGGEGYDIIKKVSINSKNEVIIIGNCNPDYILKQSLILHLQKQPKSFYIAILIQMDNLF